MLGSPAYSLTSPRTSMGISCHFVLAATIISDQLHSQSSQYSYPFSIGLHNGVLAEIQMHSIVLTTGGACDFSSTGRGQTQQR